MRTMLCFVLAALSLAAQTPVLLELEGTQSAPVTYTATDLAALPHEQLPVTVDGLTTNYSGIWLDQLLLKAGAPLGDKLRGKALSSYVLASAKDGYQVLFSLGEIDPDLSGKRIFLADSADGHPLAASSGPLRLVIPSDKRGARSVRMLTKLSLITLRK